jgi:predicted transposase/invertase (TIGR01784 family)
MLQLADGTLLRYSSLKPAITLNILGYPHFIGDDDALRVFTLNDRKRNKSFDTEYFMIAYFELTKGNVETENQRHWQTYFKTGVAPDGAPEYIRKAARVIEIANLTKEERSMIDQMERAREIYKNELYSAQLEGERIGEARGVKIGKAELKEERRAIAQSLLESGMSIADISRHTKLSEDEIRRFAH